MNADECRSRDRAIVDDSARAGADSDAATNAGDRAAKLICYRTAIRQQDTVAEIAAVISARARNICRVDDHAHGRKINTIITADRALVEHGGSDLCVNRISRRLDRGAGGDRRNRRAERDPEVGVAGNGRVAEQMPIAPQVLCLQRGG